MQRKKQEFITNKLYKKNHWNSEKCIAIIYKISMRKQKFVIFITVVVPALSKPELFDESDRPVCKSTTTYYTHIRSIRTLGIKKKKWSHWSINW